MLDTISLQYRPATPSPAARTRALRALVLVALVTYLALLTWAIVWKFNAPFVGSGLGPLKLTPFAATDGFGPSAPGEVAANFLAFVPLGALLAAFAPRGWYPAHAVVIAGTSTAFEALQFVLGVGAADVTDVLVNTAGGLVGLALIESSRTRHVRGTAAVFGRSVVFGLMLLLIAYAAWVLALDLA